MQIKRPAPTLISMEISLDISSGQDHLFLKLDGTTLTVITLVSHDDDEEWQGEVGSVEGLDASELLGELQDWIFDTEDANDENSDDDVEEPGTFRYEIPVTNYGYAYRDEDESEIYFIPSTDSDTVTLNAYTVSDARTLIACFTEILRCQADAKRLKTA